MPIHGYPGNIITANPTAPTVSAASGVWTTEQQLQAVSQGNWPGYEYPISRSLRFNSADSAYLNRTLTTPTNNLKWTWSAWVKRSALGTASNLICAGDGTSNNSGWLAFNSSNILQFYQLNGGSYNVQMTTSAVFRDVSAWYHIVLVYDSANATSTDRVQIYVNGVRQTVSYAVGPFAQNTASKINSAIAHYIGKLDYTTQYSNEYQTEVNFIDGQALTPSSFGLNDPETGIWSPKQYTGTYGTNGFYLNFSDNSGITATTLGKDYSGNGNNWTPNNFSVTAGVGNDSLVDTPTSYGTDTGVGGEVRGNYCTLNPLDAQGTATLTNGNLTIASATTAHRNRKATFLMPTSGKWYFELTTSSTCSASVILGWGLQTTAAATDSQAGSANTWMGQNDANQDVWSQTTNLVSAGSAVAGGAIRQLAYDADSGKLWFGVDNTWYSSTDLTSGNPSTGANPCVTLSAGSYFPTVSCYNITADVNFGQRPFAYTAPSGFKALCTQNLPTPTIGATSTTQANDYFNTVLYTGNGSTQSITGVGFQPDFVWIKNRGTATDHGLFDAIRGTTKRLSSNLTNAETTEVNSLTAFNSDGFSVGATQDFNQNTVGIVAWNWNAGGSNATNTSGTITSTVRANTTAGFSIVTFNIPGSGTSDTVGHGLGVAPSMVILKPRTAGTSWGVYHSGLTSAAYYLTLQTTNAQTLSNNWWNSTAPTSSVFTIGSTWYGTTNAVAYCFAAIAGYSAFGSYTGNGSTDGPFVFLGFRPRWILIKNSSAAASWYIYDAVRNTFNVVDKLLYPNLSNAEDTYTFGDILSNGFKIRSTDGGMNGNGNTIIYAAFAESPFKYALAR